MFVPFVAPSLTLKRCPCVTSVNCNIVFDSATVSCCAHKLRILNVYLVDNGPERQLCVLEGGDQCAVHGLSRCA